MRRFRCDEFWNLAGMTESAYSDATSVSPGAFASNTVTASQPSYPIIDHIIDPRLLLPFNWDRGGPESNVAPRHEHQPISRVQVQSRHAITHHGSVHRQYTFQPMNPNTSFLPPRCPTRVKKGGANERTVKHSPQRRPKRRSNRIAGIHTEHPQDQPPKKKRKSRALGNKAADDTATGEEERNSEPEGHHGKLGGRASRIRWTNGVMEWLDESGSQWKPAGYHRDHRAELIALNAQQAGAPVWTPDMGTDYTSYSVLTKHWTKDPSSVIDDKGRRVLLEEEVPADRTKKTYGPLIYNGLIMLDHKDCPMRDIPGVPHTFSTREKLSPGWLLQGLRESTQACYADFEARTPATRVTAKGNTKNVQRQSALTNRVARYYRENPYLKRRCRRPRAQKIELPPAAIPDHQDSLFDGEDFRYILPRTAAEVTFIKSTLEYTRAHYRSLIMAEPPVTLDHQSYAEQYGQMQEHLELNRRLLDLPPVKLRAIGPVSGGLDQS